MYELRIFRKGGEVESARLSSSERWWTCSKVVTALKWLMLLPAFCMAVIPVYRTGRSWQCERLELLVDEDIASGRVDLAVANLVRLTKLRPDEFRATFQLANCLLQIPSPNQGNVRLAKALFEQSCDLAPENVDAWTKLAETELALGNAPAAVNAARRLRALVDGNQASLDLYVQALVASGDIAKAQQIIATESNSDPSNWKTLLLDLTSSTFSGVWTQSDHEAFLERCRGIGEPMPRYLLESTSNRIVGDIEEARVLFKQTCEEANYREEPELLRLFTRVADELSESANAVAMLSKHTGRLEDPYLRLWFGRKSWEIGAPANILAMLGEHDARLATEPELVWLKALSLRALERQSRLREVRQGLVEGSTTNAAQSWSKLITLATLSSNEMQTTSQKQFAVDLVETSEKVLEISPNSPTVQFVLASSYFALGEYVVSAKLANECERLAPNWLLPTHLKVTAHILSGDHVSARAGAVLLRQRFPSDFNASLLFASVLSMDLEGETKETAEGLLCWSGKVALGENDPRINDLVLVRWAALDRLGKTDELKELEVEYLKAWTTEEIDNESIRQLIQLLAPRRLQTAMQSNTLFANATKERGEIPVSEILAPAVVSQETQSGQGQSTWLSERGEMAEVRLGKPRVGGALNWRLLKARELLQGDSGQEDAANSALLLRPVTQEFVNCSDANVLQGLSLIKLHDAKGGSEFLLLAATQEPEWVPNLLRLSLHTRQTGEWSDATALVNFWVMATKAQYVAAGDRDHSQESLSAKTNLVDKSIDRLTVLAEFAEQGKDEPLAIATYRRLLSLSPDIEFAANNLSVLLSKQPNHIAEALQLVSGVVKSNPNNASYADTYQEVSRLREAQTAKEQQLVRDNQSNGN